MKSEKEFFDEIKTYKFLANKSLGQNFLINPDVCKQIVDKLETNENDKVLEIGSGLGSLSYFLVRKGNVDLIDIDERMLSFLDKSFSNLDNVNIKRENVLKADLQGYSKIIGNLPYYITSHCIEYILLNAKNAAKIVLMTQKEVYPKLIGKEISPLSLLLNYVAKISNPINVGRNNFTPVPHVDSVVFELIPNENIKKDNHEVFELMVKMFLYRRKTILNSLSYIVSNKKDAEEILNKLKVDLNKRPEQLGIDFYFLLLNELKNFKQTHTI